MSAEEKNGRTFDEEASLPYERYVNTEYFTRAQFDSLVSQLLVVAELKPQTVLEIGPGNGFVSSFLKKSGFKVTTFDINANLKPDVIGNLAELDRYFEDKTFDLILCAEVLEHLPFEYFNVILEKFNNIAKEHIVITLPRQHRILLDLRVLFKIPFIPYQKINWFLRIPNRTKWEEHHWEIDYSPEFSLEKIKYAMRQNLDLVRSWVDERHRTHQFFILKPL